MKLVEAVAGDKRLLLSVVHHERVSSVSFALKGSKHLKSVDGMKSVA